MKEKKKKDEKDTGEQTTRRQFLSTGKTVLLGASYVVISLAAGRGTAMATCTGATTTYPPPCTSCTGCTGCTGCTKACTGGCCISCTKCTSQ